MSEQRHVTNRLVRNGLISAAIFLLALLPRAYALDRFVTADEAKWVYRSAQFLAAFLQGHPAGTSVNLTPAVTTTWLGSAGLWAYHLTQVADAPLVEWLLAQPQFRVELPLLVAVRWPGVLLSALLVVALFWLARALFGAGVAFIAAVFIALDPHTVALSRILGHDVWATLFMNVSLLLLLLAIRPAGRRWHFGLSGAVAGLAMLSKAPALFLMPFAGLVLAGLVWAANGRLRFWLGRFVLWGTVAYLTFVIVWPATWLDPVGRPWAVTQNAFLSATDQEEADSEGYWRVPNLGPLYYVVNGGFKLSPLVMTGVGLALVFGTMNWRRRVARRKLVESPLVWLLAFVMLFTIFMTLGDKRSARYILPVFPALAVVAAAGWRRLFRWATKQWTPPVRTKAAVQAFYLAGLTAAAALVLVPAAPYYLSYYNPLLGGPAVASRLVKIGWGEGLDQVGRFLQRELPGSRVGTAYASTVAPFFSGDLSAVTGDHLDYLVLYKKQVQSGEPAPAFIEYFEQQPPVFSVNLAGIRYADVYHGPALRLLSGDARPGQPVGYRALSPYGRIGEPLDVDVVWRRAGRSSPPPATVSMRAPQDDRLLAEAAGQISLLDGDLAVSRHRLQIPADLPRGSYGLFLNGQPLGQLELRNFQTPATLGQVRGVEFERQVALTGYQFEPTEDYLAVTVAWRAMQSHLPDYTVFTQLLDVDTNNRVAGFDTQPRRGEYPTSRWIKDEVVVDRYVVAVPPDLEPGYYKIIVGLYRPETGQRLRLANGQDHWLVPWTFIWKGQKS